MVPVPRSVAAAELRHGVRCHCMSGGQRSAVLAIVNYGTFARTFPIESDMSTYQNTDLLAAGSKGSITSSPSIDIVLERLGDAGHEVKIIGPFSNGHRLIEVDEIVRNHQELAAMLEHLPSRSPVREMRA